MRDTVGSSFSTLECLRRLGCRGSPEAPAEDLGSTLIQYREVNAIFKNSPIEGTTSKETTIYVNEARRDNHLATMTHPLHLLESRFFSPKKIHMLCVSLNAVVVVMMHIGWCKVSKILVDRGSSNNILHDHTLDQIDDASELAQELIISQTQSLLYGFDGNETRSPDMVPFLVRANPCRHEIQHLGCPIPLWVFFIFDISIYYKSDSKHAVHLWILLQTLH